jgi:hypothetical protein
MKKRSSLPAAFIPLVITLCLFVVFNARIESKPDHAGFWFILALGMALGVALTRLFQWQKERKSNRE